MLISVTILTKNSEKYLKQVLDALSDFQEVLIFDNGSTDQTLKIASRYSNVTIHEGTFEGFGITHNKASNLAQNDWILSIDSDEIVTKEMKEAILHLNLDKESVYSFPRHNYFNGRFIKWCGWYPDRQVRLFNRTTTQFTEAQVHEAVNVSKMHQIKLEGPIVHYSYDSIAEFLSKMQSYSNLFAQQYVGKRSSSPLKAISHGFFAFFKSYILKRGILGGYEGYLISAYNGHTAYYKYLKLYEANCRKKN
ncbi:MAG: glycosyltransferase family 2 protein [Parachlamydiaceae bacterium]|nr:glycosyltransferase family 2 protein [Parachlamydiaceae bacterium]